MWQKSHSRGQAPIEVEEYAMPVFCHAQSQSQDNKIAPFSAQEAWKALEKTTNLVYMKNGFSAEQWELDMDTGRMYFSGNALLSYHGHSLSSQRMWVELSPEKKVDFACLSGEVFWYYQDWSIAAQAVRFKAPGQWSSSNVVFYFPGEGLSLRGQAKLLRKEQAASFEAVDAEVTSCPLNDVVWSIAANKLFVDKDHVDARGATVHSYGYTLLRLPRLQFSAVKSSAWSLPQFRSFGDSGAGVQLGYTQKLRQGHSLVWRPYLTLKAVLGVQIHNDYTSKTAWAHSMLSFSKKPKHSLQPLVAFTGVSTDEKSQLEWEMVRALNGLRASELRGFFADKGEAWRPYQDLKGQVVFTKGQSFGDLSLSSIHYQRFSQRDAQVFWNSDTYVKGSLVLKNLQNKSVDGAVGIYAFKGNRKEIEQRGLLYAEWSGEEHLTPSSKMSWNLGGWQQEIVTTQTQSSRTIANIEWRWDYSWTQHVQSELAYAYTQPGAQTQNILTWPERTWAQELHPQRLVSLESRLFDRNWLRGAVYYEGKIWSTRWEHYASLQSSRVSLTTLGQENPLRDYPLGVSTLRLQSSWLSAKTTFIWPRRQIWESEGRFGLLGRSGVTWKTTKAFPGLKNNEPAVYSQTQLGFEWVSGSLASGQWTGRLHMRHDYQQSRSVSIAWRREHACVHSYFQVGFDAWDKSSSSKRVYWPRLSMRVDLKGLHMSTPRGLLSSF